MSQNSENDDSDDDCEYFLQPVSNQYNITDKIKEANQELYKGEQHQRSSHPKVRFRDHQLVDFEPDEESVELMERRASISLSTNSSNITINSNIPKIKEEESSDDGYIDEEDEATVTDGGDRVIVESIEIEEVCEQIEILDAMTVDIVESDNNGGAIDEENYTKDEFHEDEDESAIVTAIKIKPDKKQKKQPPQQQQQLMKPQQEKRRGSSKKVFRSKINPSVDEVMVTSATTTTSIELIGERTSATTRKMCCQHKNGYKEKLPKYNGFFSSNYGLSKEELERRSANQLRHNEIQQSREVKKSEQKDHVAKVNEEAFAKWLRKKMRNTINKSNPINMYDVKMPSTKEKQQRQIKRRQIQRQMETEEHDEEDDEGEESEAFDEEEI